MDTFRPLFRDSPIVGGLIPTKGPGRWTVLRAVSVEASVTAPCLERCCAPTVWPTRKSNRIYNVDLAQSEPR